MWTYENSLQWFGVFCALVFFVFFVFFFFGSFSTDSKVTWQKVDAWSFNKGEIEIYKPLSSYLVHFLGRKIKQGAVHVACPVRDSCPALSGPLAGFTVSLEVPHLVVDPFSWIPKGFPTHSDDISQQRLCIHWALTKESWTQHRPRLPAEGWSGRGFSWVGLSLSRTRRVIIVLVSAPLLLQILFTLVS